MCALISSKMAYRSFSVYRFCYIGSNKPVLNPMFEMKISFLLSPTDDSVPWPISIPLQSLRSSLPPPQIPSFSHSPPHSHLFLQKCRPRRCVPRSQRGSKLRTPSPPPPSAFTATNTSISSTMQPCKLIKRDLPIEKYLLEERQSSIPLELLDHSFKNKCLFHIFLQLVTLSIVEEED